jgi:alkyl hydroperoxide reductase subunit AhpC
MSSGATMTPPRTRRSLHDMITPTRTSALPIAADAFVRGERRRTLRLDDYRGTWVVLAFGVRHADVLELAELEEAFAADGAVVLAASADDWHVVEQRFGAETTVRFPILTSVDERRRLTVIVDPAGAVRHVGIRRSARETLAVLEAQLTPLRRAA